MSLLLLCGVLRLFDFHAQLAADLIAELAADGIYAGGLDRLVEHDLPLVEHDLLLRGKPNSLPAPPPLALTVTVKVFMGLEMSIASARSLASRSWRALSFIFMVLTLSALASCASFFGKRKLRA